MSEQRTTRVEWAVKHAQGIHRGPFTEQQARDWIARDVERDGHRQFRVRGKQCLLRRYVTEWEEVPLAATPPPGAAAGAEWPCANYTEPVTCLTAPSSEAGRCDYCASVAAGAAGGES